MEEKQGALYNGLITQIECNIGEFQVVVDSLCTRLCPKNICQPAMLFKANQKSSVGSQKQSDLLISKIALIFSVHGLKGFLRVAYPNTLLDFDSSFANAKFAQEYCSDISTFL